MGSTSDKVTGYANEAVGKLKKNAGRIVGSEKMEIEGGLQELKGKAQVEIGKTKAAIVEGADKITEDADRKL